MAQRGLPWLIRSTTWVCRQCRAPRSFAAQSSQTQTKRFSATALRSDAPEISAAPEIDLNKLDEVPARIVPASPSYFTASPVLNDNLLLLQQLVERHQALPTLPPDQTPRAIWMTLSQYRSVTGEKVAASKYAKVLALLSRLNKIPVELRHWEIRSVLNRFQRPGTTVVRKFKPGKIDEYGRSIGVGRRKESSARVYLVEGTGEVLINGKSIVQVFPRLHDRESALWALKISERMDKYNVFALVQGGGVTGQAEAITIGLARALLVHEPALKPALRRAGCVTFDARRVERKKPGHVKARKMPTWVKR